jgi:hypothetical protein
VKHTIRIIILFILLSFAAVWESHSTGGDTGPCCSVSLPSFFLYAQEAAKPSAGLSPVTETDRSADASSVLYRVAGVILIIWLGLALFLYRIDRRVTKLERSISDAKDNTRG